MRIFILWLLSFLNACAYLEKAKELQTNSPKIAQVGNSVLYKKDIEGLVPANTPKDDSINITERFVEAWIRKNLLYEQAQKLKSEEETQQIEQRVEEYRKQLLLYAYQKEYIDQNMDTLVLDKQIQQYYEQFPESFVLNNTIFKGFFVKILKNSPRLNEVKSLLTSNSTEDKEKLKSSCVLNAVQYSLDENKWTALEPVVANTPFTSLLTKRQISKGIFENQDETYIYWLKVQQIRFSGEQAPLDFAQDMIRDIILSKRKVDLQKQLEEQIFEKATQNQSYEIFRN